VFLISIMKIIRLGVKYVRCNITTRACHYPIYGGPISMKVIVLAGGYATRLWPLTITRPKPLLPLGNKLIIDYIIEKAQKLSPEKIIVSTNKAFRKDFEKWWESRRKNGVFEKNEVDIFVEQTVREEEKLGTIGALKLLFDSFGPDDYLIVAGDNIFSYELTDFYKEYNKKDPLVAVYDIKDKTLVSIYSQVILDKERRIIKFEEKPSNPITSLIATACYAFPPKIVDLLKEYLESGGKKDAPGFFIEWLHKRESIYAYIFEGYWFDIGTPRTYLEAHRTMLKGSYISSNVEIEDGVKVIPPVFIGDHATIQGNSTIGPYAYIGNDSIIRNSEIRESIIMEEVSISESSLVKSIVGVKSKIERMKLKESTIGDYTKLYGPD